MVILNLLSLKIIAEDVIRNVKRERKEYVNAGLKKRKLPLLKG
jgi:hypothetical protein